MQLPSEYNKDVTSVLVASHLFGESLRATRY